MKRLRDRELGGVIRFVPALLAGLGISAVAGVIYAIGWEITLAVTDFAFIDSYSNAAVEAARAKGASAAEVQAVIAQMDEFRRQYANPFFRLPMTFIEIFPVGVLISLISAGLLRNSRFLPARTTGAVSFRGASDWLSPVRPEHRQLQSRRIAGLMMNRDRRSPGRGGNDLGLAGLQIARQMRGERRRNLRANPVTLCEPDTRHQCRQAQFIDASRFQRLAARRGVPVARAQYVVAGTHEVERAAVGVHVLQPHPEVEVATIAGGQDHRGDVAGDPQILRQRLGLEREEVLAGLERADSRARRA